MWSGAISLGLLLQALTAQAIIRYECNDPGLKTKIQNAVEEAIEMATTASNRLKNNLNDDWVQAPLKLFFVPEEAGQIGGLYDTISTLGASNRIVTFYCEENHLQWDQGLNSWTDRAYHYEYTNQHGKQRGYIVYNMRDQGGGSNVPPGQANGGSSYTTQGYRVTIPNAPAGQDIADCSDQSHVFIGRDRIEKQYPFPYDTRSFKTMVETGFTVERNGALVVIEAFVPLSHTAFHELIHVVGGLADSRATVGDGKITDGPNEEVYDLQNCLMKNRDRKLGLGLSPINFAQPLTYLAEALYLQIKNDENKPTYWTFGMILPDTLAPPQELIDEIGDPSQVTAANTASFARSIIDLVSRALGNGE